MSSKTLRWWWLAVPALALAALYPTPFGSWVESLIYGTGARWEEAYAALDTAEDRGRSGGSGSERVRIANAMAESEPPAGLPLGPRLHPAGTLARLRYETFDENGAPLDTWDVRALVPNIGNGVGPFWREPCDRKCSEEVEGGSGTRIYRSGQAGIAEEWVLRMPVGKAFALRAQPLRTQDILDPQERSHPMSSVRVGERTLPRPAQMRVTLVEACPGRVRVGSTQTLKLEESPPIPRGFRTSRWAQIDGCGRLKPLQPPSPLEDVQIELQLQVR